MAFLKTFLMALCLSATTTAKRHMREIQLQKELELMANDYLSGDISAFSDELVPKVYWQNVSLPIDHTGKCPEVGNFSNRFWVMDEFYEPGGPVFTLDTGESYGGQNYLGYLTRNTTFFYQYLRQFKGIGIVWEHRYYGESLPFPVDLNTTSEQMQYLTTENALKDFVVFANQWEWKNYTVNPKKTPWVVVGGSYPGMRAAMLRHLYPETVYASYASSAPVQARKDMSIYWEQAYRGMIKYNLKNCTVAIKYAVDYIDSQLARPYTAAQIKKQYLGRTADEGSNAGFADTLAFPLYNWQSAGVDDTLREFCDHLNAGQEPEDERLRGKYYSDRWAAWPTFVELVNENNVFALCEGPVRNDTITPNCLLDERFDGGIGISWTWQYCTEWGFYQPTNIGEHALGSRYNNLQHQQDICYRQFPDGLSSGLLPRAPRTEYMNNLTGGWTMRPSNTMWTGGEFDPWRTLTPLSEESFSEHYQLTNVAPACGVPTANDTVFGYLMADSEHCFDFRTLDQAKIPQQLFADALTEWLKCFGRESGTYS